MTPPELSSGVTGSMLTCRRDREPYGSGLWVRRWGAARTAHLTVPGGGTRAARPGFDHLAWPFLPRSTSGEDYSV